MASLSGVQHKMCRIASASVVLSMVLVHGQATAKEPEKAVADPAMPSAIRRHSEAFRTGWLSLTKTIVQNAKRDRPLPEPYLARGQLLSVAGDHENALDDYLSAIRAARGAGATVAEQARYLGVLHQAMERRAKAPEPLYTADALQQFRAGRALYDQKKFPQALVRFSSAVKGDPKTAIYLYYRGLTLKRMKKDAEASRDIRRAISLDVGRIFGDGLFVDRDELRTYRAREFERLQGPIRMWLESHYDGLPLSGRENTRK